MTVAAPRPGEPVLVHCLAGAHRAGTAGVAWLMRAGRLPLQAALRQAQARRGVIDPYGYLLQLLALLEIGMGLREVGVGGADGGAGGGAAAAAAGGGGGGGCGGDGAA